MKANNTRILVVDEESFCAWLVRNNLESRGYEILATGDGQTVLEFVTSWEPHLVILGCRLPDLDGFEICQRIREFSRVPIIILTAPTQQADRVKGLQMGADDCMTKPISIDELVARMRALLRRVEFSKEKDLWRLVKARDLCADHPLLDTPVDGAIH